MSGIFRINGYNSVRRINSKKHASGGFLPTDIAGLQLWLDFSDASTLFTDAGTTPVSADGDAIYQANDKSGKGFHGTQATLASRPIYKTGVKNGLSGGSFISQWLTLPDALRNLLTQRLTIFVVFSNNDDSTYRTTYIGTRYWSDGNFVLGRHDSLIGAFVIGNNKAAWGATKIYEGDWHSIVASANYDVSSQKLFLDGDLDASRGYTTAFNFTYPLLLGGHCGYGNSDQFMTEVLIYSPDLSDTDRQSVESYLNSKWAIY